jgi:hypothetical protein
MGLLTDILKEIPTSGVLKERVALAEQKYDLLEQQNENLKLENARLKSELAAIKSAVPSSAFMEARGVLFKRKANGSFEPEAYCPDCERVLSTFEEMVFPPSCSRCRFQAPFFKKEIAGIIAELQAGL